MTSVAIMQPTYLPWIGYFGLIDSVDIFIFLDSVQFAKRSWQQRNKIKTANDSMWLSVPVFSKGKRDQIISQVEIDYSGKYPSSHIASIENNYRKSRFYSDYSDELFSILHNSHKSLSELNVELIMWFSTKLGIATQFEKSSNLENSGSKAGLLAMLCEQVKCTEYVSPPGSKEYLDASDAFKQRNIPTRYYEYNHPQYRQMFGEFVPYMSIVDLLFNMGPDSLSLIKKGYQV